MKFGTFRGCLISLGNLALEMVCGLLVFVGALAAVRIAIEFPSVGFGGRVAFAVAGGVAGYIAGSKLESALRGCFPKPAQSTRIRRKRAVGFDVLSKR